MKPMRALTVHRPWSELLVRGVKDFENRSWPLPGFLWRRWVAIHAGKAWAPEALEMMKLAGCEVGLTDKGTPTGIVGLVRFDKPVQESDSLWFQGPEGWPVIEAWAFAKPIPCGGRQGLWFVPNHVRDEIYRRTGL